jgi:hypothetical protein
MSAFGEISPFSACGIQVEAAKYIRASPREYNQNKTDMSRSRAAQGKWRQH